MKIIKKSDIKEYKNDSEEPTCKCTGGCKCKGEKEGLDELVDADGVMATGDKVLNYDSQVNTGVPITGNDHEEGSVQHRNIFGYGSTSYSRGIRKVTESKIKSIIEDILNKNKNNNDLVSVSTGLDSKISKFIKSISVDTEELGIEGIIKKIKDKLNNAK